MLPVHSSLIPNLNPQMSIFLIAVNKLDFTFVQGFDNSSIIDRIRLPAAKSILRKPCTAPKSPLSRWSSAPQTSQAYFHQHHPMVPDPRRDTSAPRPNHKAAYFPKTPLKDPSIGFSRTFAFVQPMFFSTQTITDLTIVVLNLSKLMEAFLRDGSSSAPGSCTGCMPRSKIVIALVS